MKFNVEQRKIIASEGMVITDGEIYGKEIYLGIHDSPDRYHEITDAEYAEVLRKEEEALLNEFPPVADTATATDYEEALESLGVKFDA